MYMFTCIYIFLQVSQLSNQQQNKMNIIFYLKYKLFNFILECMKKFSASVLKSSPKCVAALQYLYWLIFLVTFAVTQSYCVITQQSCTSVCTYFSNKQRRLASNAFSRKNL